MITPSSSYFGSEYEMQYSGYRTMEHIPWYQTIGQPLIYYAQLQPECCKTRKKENRKNTPNCFAKAFRWYTQEHTPFNDMVTNKVNEADIKDFASWLDDKYNEYLQTKSDQKHFVVNQTSTRQIFDASNKLEDARNKRNKRSKIISPWKKRKRSGSKDKGDVLCVLKSNQSIEVIFKQKELFRPASECCQKCVPSCKYFNSATQSEMSAIDRLKPKSRSLSSVLKEKEIYAFDTSYNPQRTINNEPKPKDNQRLSARSSRRLSPKNRAKDISCQCTNVKFTNNAASQFEKTAESNICIREDIATTLRKKYTSPKVQETRRDCFYDNNNIQIDGKKNETFTHISLRTFDESLQTSNISIQLEDKIQYPYLMKIVCAERFK